MTLVWTLPNGESTARWATPDGGPGGTPDLAQVLAAGGDPDGNPITGALTLSPNASGKALNVVAGAGSSDLASFFDNDENFGFAVGRIGAYLAGTGIGDLLQVESGDDFDRVLTVGPTGAVTISPSDPAAVALTAGTLDQTAPALILNTLGTSAEGGTIGAQGQMALVAGVGGGVKTTLLTDVETFNDSGDGIYWENATEGGADRQASFYVGGEYKIRANVGGIGFFDTPSVAQQTRPTTLNEVIDLLVAYGLSA